MKRDLRPHQHAALALLRASLAEGKKRPVLAAPTGFGKTVLAGAVIDGALRKGKRVIVTVPALSLIDQAVASFWAEGFRDIGVLQGNHPLTNPHMPVQVASVQTLQRRTIPRADLVMIDECHRWFEFYGDWMSDPEWAKVPFVGLSATPWTKGLGKHFDDLLIAATTKQLIEMGFLSPFRVFAPSHPDLSGVKTVAGDYHEGQLANAMQQGTLMADAVTTWLAKAEGRPTLLFAVDRAHAQHLQEQFIAAGVRTEYIDAYTTREEREIIRVKFHNGEVQVVCNVGCLTTGIDWDVRCLSLCRPTKSEMLFVQIVGRGLRTAEGKADCLARGTLVLTDKGEVPIENVTRAHKVWDGETFVGHAGAVCRGVQPVIAYDGLVATADHRVMTDDGWISLAEAARRRLRIARSGMGGRPLRFAGDCLAQGRREQRQAPGGGLLQALFGTAPSALSQHQEAAQYSGVSALQWATAGTGAAVALPTLPSAARPLSEPIVYVIRALRRTWDRVSVRWSERSGAMDRGQSRYCGSLNGDRPDRKRGALRAWQFALGQRCREHEQYTQNPEARAGAVHCVSAGVSRGALCRQNPASSDSCPPDGRRDHRALVDPVLQTEREVWDILSAGPLQRFTANGRLVHNCLILDHSDTTLRLGFVTDIHHDALDDGKPKVGAKRKAETPLPKECSSCGILKPVRMRTCQSCGFAPTPAAAQHDEGELVEWGVDGKGDTPVADRGTKQRWFSMLTEMAVERGYKSGWVAHTFRKKFGVWPRGLTDAPLYPDAEVRGYVRHLMIRHAKSQRVAA